MTDMTALMSRLSAWIRSGPATTAVILSGLAACGQAETPSSGGGRPVDVIAVEASKLVNDVQLSGEIQAENTVALAFRIGGRVVERPVNVGDRIAAGQLVARLDPQTEQNALTAAKAALSAARGEVGTARNAFERQDQLMAQGFTTRPRFDQALQAKSTAEAALEDAEARVELARDRLGFTELRSSTAGVVTARSAEPGEVVQPGQAIVRLARDDGRDAVFNVPARFLEQHLHLLLRFAVALREVDAERRIERREERAEVVDDAVEIATAELHEITGDQDEVGLRGHDARDGIALAIGDRDTLDVGEHADDDRIGARALR